TCIVDTQSRGGQLVYLAVIAAYGARRFGVRGLVASALLAVPLVLYGGRADESAGGSSAARLKNMYVVRWLLWKYTIRGFSRGQILEYHTQTAHNSYALAAAELGFPGMVAWSAVLYLSVKIPIAALRANPDSERRIWAMSLLACLAGLLV